MRKILFLSKGEKSASTRYRALSYFPELKKNGWDPSHMGLHEGPIRKLKILRAAKNADVVVLLRHGLSFPFRPLLRYFSHKLIFDFDDAIFLKSSGEDSLLRSRRFDRTVVLCDRIWGGNRYLADRALSVNSGTIVLPTSVKMSRYRAMANKPLESLDLVWIGSSSTRKYLEDILPILERTSLLIPNLRLKIIADFSLESEVLRIVSIPWREETEVAHLCSAHIGIAPMRDDPWTRGKCALKVLQYMASGLPVVSSRVGANSDVLDHGRTGFLVNSEDEWVSAFVTLSKSNSLRNEMGNAGRAVCEKNYSIDKCTALMLSELLAVTKMGI